MLVGIAACGSSSSRPSASTAARSPGGTSSTAASTASLQQSYIKVINQVAPEVVQISTPSGLGSGVVFDDKGDVVTNAHVVAGGAPLTVTDSHGHRYKASLVGKFTEDDLAVVRAHGASLPVASFANSESLDVGDIVLALGNPLGLRSSVTNGIISALGRTVDEPNGVVLPNVIQTSAAINPGNSGGALINLQGRVVGIPTLAATDPQLGGGAAPGIGFAIPSSLVTDIAGQIIKHGHVVQSHRAYIGIELATGAVSGAVVAAVQPGGPAADAGIAVGDAITSIRGQTVTSAIGLVDVLAGLKPGTTVTVGIAKPSGAHSTVHVKLAPYPGTSP